MIVLHHLNFSRSSRVLWLLEELGLDYRLVRYERNAQFRAPPELAEVHPLGKAPVETAASPRPPEPRPTPCTRSGCNTSRARRAFPS